MNTIYNVNLIRYKLNIPLNESTKNGTQMKNNGNMNTPEMRMMKKHRYVNMPFTNLTSVSPWCLN
jgi:hypothetical protein